MSTKYDMIAPFLRPHIQEMEGYISAGMEVEKTPDIIFLNANENPYELPGLEGANRYPEPQPRELAAKMAYMYGVGANNLVITRGADESIAIALRAFCEPGSDDILLCPPCFGVYKVYGNTMPCRKIITAPLIKSGNTFTLDLEAIKAALHDPQNSIKLVFLTNPNNPTGGSFAPEDIQYVIDMAEGRAMVILDETYAEFLPGCSFTEKLENTPHLIILRTLSKSYSLAGMRVGALLSGVPELIFALRTKVMETYPIPRGSVDAALKIFKPENMHIAKDNIKKLIKERGRMEEFWNARNYVREVYQSDANFLLIEMDRATEFSNYCKEKGVILRDFSKDPLTPNSLRIAIGTPQQNEILIKLAGEFFGG